jgi:hypothetical protein
MKALVCRTKEVYCVFNAVIQRIEETKNPVGNAGFKELWSKECFFCRGDIDMEWREKAHPRDLDSRVNFATNLRCEVMKVS